MRLVGMVAVLAAGCGIPEPINEEVDPPPGADAATEMAVIEWAGRIGDHSVTPDRLPPVRWFEGPCLDYGGRAEAVCAHGSNSIAFTGGSEIHLVYRDRPSASSLPHEVLHWALSESRGRYDGDHRLPLWGQLYEVERMLSLAGM